MKQVMRVKCGMVEVLVLSALLQSPILSLTDTMETNQSPKPPPSPTDPVLKPTSPSPNPPEPKLLNQILPYTKGIGD